ncbi:glycosyltransferase family 4 protein [Tessaracoccus rhinocerotis]|uniref:Glycosyltransferase family 4 protein n=1 Tax=Tessaracoccus rhinocerotis TaxID=1689449 RepID=A0A553JZ96_9ACTN|nr:glycosyltransferase family 4 protein [Tessaracoccus rhinocerotis]TRY17788.1 glycosyltransferase family 4 protein [Tessaracoccus rhinocerotis]
MSLHTPVVFTDDPEIQAMARSRHWRYVERHPDNPQVLRLPGVDTLCSMPQAAMSITDDSLGEASLPVWTYVLNWLARFVHKPMPVVEANSYATELALWASRTRDWPMGALVAGRIPANTQQAVALFTAADGFFIPDENLSAKFTAAWPALVRLLPDQPLVPNEPIPPVPATRRTPGTTRVLLVGYYGGPSPTVGSQRINYWFEQLETLSNGRVTADVALATPWPEAPARVHQVRDLGPANLVGSTGGLAYFARGVMDEAASQSYPASRQVAGTWHWRLIDYFRNREDEYDVVIITGNPFPPFEFAHFATRHWYARTILDYRDPFAMSPRVAFTPESRAGATYIEAGWNMSADVVTVVNDACVALAVPGEQDPNVVVIPNGFDERVTAPARPQQRAAGPVRFGHAGQLFPITPPDPLLEAISHTAAEFHHMGTPLRTEIPANVTNYGRLPRSEVLETLGGMDCGVAYMAESGIETPTKVFDYLAAGLDLLLLHRGNIEGTALAAMLDGVAGAHFVKDTVEDISAWLATYEPMTHTDPARAERFSRRASTMKLIDLILELGDHEFDAPDLLGG